MRSCRVFALAVFCSALFAGTNPSLEAVLSQAGRIMEGVSGSSDFTGFRMTYALDGEQLFVEDGSFPGDVPEGQDSEGTWHPLGSGVGGSSPSVRAIAMTGSDAFVGGIFTQAGGNPANYIARWDGSAWHALGSGVSGSSYPRVFAISVSGSDVYAGGLFTQAGGNPANYIARWDGSAWHALGSGLDSRVYAVAVSGSDVYAGGLFTQAGGNPANYIARWDGSSWNPLGSGVNGYVHAISVSGSDVYVGGWFTQAGGNLVNYIARWDGSSWHALGSGVNDYVYAIAVSGSDVYAGGYFGQAGGNPASYIARWVPDPVGTEPPVGEVVPGGSLLLQASPNPMATGTYLSFQSTGLSPLTLSIYDTAGRLVMKQDLGTLPVGSQNHYWNGSDGNGAALASGVYFVRLSGAEHQASTRVVLVR